MQEEKIGQKKYVTSTSFVQCRFQFTTCNLFFNCYCLSISIRPYKDVIKMQAEVKLVILESRHKHKSGYLDKFKVPSMCV